MKNKTWQVYQYILYLLRSFHLHGIHSPFVYHLNEKIFKEKAKFYAFDEVESIRAKLLLTSKIIHVNDLGAGSQVNNSNKRSIQEIAKSALKKPKKAQLLFRIVEHFRPQKILELGTSLGISTAYMAKANPNAIIHTIEGSEEIAKIAAVNFKKLNVENITQVVGHFNAVLSNSLEKLQKVNMCYVDGNHKKQPTLDYFHQILPYTNEQSILIFDDIYWSREMTEAWKLIQQHQSVSITIDLFEFGIVCFKGDQAKEHFTVYH